MEDKDLEAISKTNEFKVFLKHNEYNEENDSAREQYKALLKDFADNHYKAPDNKENNNGKGMKIDGLEADDVNKQSAKGLTVEQKTEPEQEVENKKETWPEWAQKNDYKYDNTQNGEEVPGYHKVTSPEGKESEIIEDGDTRKVKSEDFKVYQKIVKDAQFDKYDFISIGENMSPEQTSLLAAACLEKGMSFEPKTTTIDLNLDCMKGLAPELVEKINKHNEEAKKLKENGGKENQEGNSTPETNKTDEKTGDEKAMSGSEGATAEEKTAEQKTGDEKAMSGENMADVRAHIAQRKKELEERKALRDMSGEKGKVSGVVIADKIAEKKISGEEKGVVTPKRGDELSAAIRNEMANRRANS